MFTREYVFKLFTMVKRLGGREIRNLFGSKYDLSNYISVPMCPN